MKTRIKQLLITIQDCISEINDILDDQDHDHDQDKDINYDHDQDQDLNQSSLIRSDQIRSEQIKKKYDIDGDLIENFISICDQYGFNYDGIDFGKYRRNVAWIVKNIDTIRNPYLYLNRVFPESSRKKIGFSVEKEPDVEPINIYKTPGQVIRDSIQNAYCVSDEDLEQKKGMINEEIYQAIIEKDQKYNLGQWDQVKENPLKIKLITAKAIKEGLIE